MLANGVIITYLQFFYQTYFEIFKHLTLSTERIDVNAQVFSIRVTIIVQQFFPWTDILRGHEKNPSFALVNDHVFFGWETGAVDEPNPGWGFNGVGVEKMGQDVIAFNLLREKYT